MLNRKYIRMKKFTLIICALMLSFASFAQVTTYPESGPGACNGSAYLNGPYIGGDLYSVNDSLNPMQTNSFNFYSLCAGSYYIMAMDSLGSTRFDFTITTDLCGGFNAYPYPNQVSAPGMCDGSSGLNVNGGAMPYTFLWSDNQTTQNAVNLCEGTYTCVVTDANACSTTVNVNISAPSPCQNFFVDIQPTAVSDSGICDGSAKAWPQNGAAPYTYSWSNGATTDSISGLCQGNYNVTVTDSLGCPYTQYIDIMVYDPCINFYVNIQPFGVSDSGMCDGNAKAFAVNGLAPFTYSWSNNATTDSISGLCMGSYNVTVTDANNCSYNQYVSIDVVSPCQSFYATVTTAPTTDSLCNGSASVNVTGGSGNYSYSWSTSGDSAQTINNLCEGSYSVFVQDLVSGCNSYPYGYVSLDNGNPCQNFNAYVNTAPSTDTVNCNGSAHVIINGGTPPFSFQWNSGETTQDIYNKCPGNYNVMVSDYNGCQYSSSGYVAPDSGNGNPCQNFYVNANVMPTSDTACTGTADIQVFNGVGPYLFVWSTGDSLTTGFKGNLCQGEYSVNVTDNYNGCQVNYSVFIGTDSGNGNPCQNFYINVIPHPNTDSLNCNGSVEVSTINGVAPYSYMWSDSSINSNILGICSGTYTVTVTDANNCTITQNATVFYEAPNPTCDSLLFNVTFVDASAQGMCDGTANAVATGGSGNYGYSWSTGDTLPNISNLCAGTYTAYMMDFSTQCQKNFTFGIADGNGNPCQNPPVVTITGPTQVVSGQSATLTATGAAFYNWSTGDSLQTITVSPQFTTSYNVTGIDSMGCSASASWTINVVSGNPCDTANIIISVQINNNTASGFCNGSAVAIVTGGTTPYNYNWSSGETQIEAVAVCEGSQTVTVSDANNCTQVANFVMLADSVPDSCAINPVVISLTSSNPTILNACDGSATATVSGGTAPYAYLWSDSSANSTITGLCAGVYTLTVTDANGCIANSSVDVVNPDPCPSFAATASSTNASDVNCVGTVTVTANGSGQYSFAWTDSSLSGSNLISLCAGTYTVTVTDLASGCMATATATVAVDSTPNPCLGFQVIIDSTLNETAPSIGDGQAFASIYGGTAPFTFNWGGGLASDTAYFYGLFGGSFTLEVIDANGCSAFANGFVGTTTPSSGPCSGVLINVTLSSINAGAGLCNGSVSSMVSGGTAPYTYTWNNGYFTPEYVNACPGNYNLLVADANGCIGAAGTLVNGDPMVAVPIVVNIATTNSSDTVNCNGSVRVNVSGGNAPYIISYSTGAAGPQLGGLCADIYGVTVTDANGDSAVFTFVIANENSVFTSTTNPLNDSVVVASITADAVENCVIDVDAVDSVLVSNYWIDLSTDSLLVQWTVFSSTLGNITMYQAYGVGPEGVYEVVLTIYCSGRATKGFVKAYDKVQVNARLTTVAQVAGKVKSEVYPNPFNSSLNINVANNSNVTISDVTGKVVANFNNLNGNNTLVTENLSKGVYFVTIQNNSSKEVVKIVKE